MNNSIGGALNYQVLAELHKPKTIEELRVAAQELLQRGYSDHGVAAALRLSVEAVRRLVSPVCETCDE